MSSPEENKTTLTARAF